MALGNPLWCVKTTNFTVDDAGAPEPITATIRCREIRVAPADGSSSYKYRAPLATSDPANKYSGIETRITRPSPGQYNTGYYGDPGHFEVGDIAGYLETFAGVGAKTFQMEEFA